MIVYAMHDLLVHVDFVGTGVVHEFVSHFDTYFAASTINKPIPDSLGCYACKINDNGEWLESRRVRASTSDCHHSSGEHLTAAANCPFRVKL